MSGRTYAELQTSSNFSFLRGASHPEELVAAAADLGHSAIGIADRNTLAGVVRAHVAAKEAGLRLLIGARLDLEDGPSILCYPKDRAAYGRLTQLLTLGKRRTIKGQCRLTLADILDGEIFQSGHGQALIVVAPDRLDAPFKSALSRLGHKIKNDLYLSVNYLYFGDDKRRIAELVELARHHAIAPVATNDVHAHTAERRPLQDVLTCIREGCTIRTAGFRLFANAERHLKRPAEMNRLFEDHPNAIENIQKIIQDCTFSLSELVYEYLIDPVPGGRTPQEELERLTWAGAARRYPDGVPKKVEAQLKDELALIAERRYAPYFLTINDIVGFARARHILCQGRGSAANSSVCYVLHITEVDPATTDLLFARFMSTEREEPPDIDVDFEHERREEVIQYIYRKYGRANAGLTATVITYRAKSALRDVGKVMGLSEDMIVALQGLAWGRPWGKTSKSTHETQDERLREAGIDPNDPTIRRTLALVRQLRGAPRHLSQHTGGFVVTKVPLDSVVPIENATMEDRTVIEWNKDDLDAIGIFKIDILALGMLTCIRKCFDLIERQTGRTLSLDTVPKEDSETYDMLCEADSVGVFQVESRAQMNMLPRLRPRTFYDLVIEVAIVRPGPIQGGMVHPYLRRRQGKEQAELPSQALKDVLGRTLGVPLFQEQAMKIAMVAAGFTAAQADKLRRSMAAFRRNGDIEKFRSLMVEGMLKNGYARDFAERCFKQIEGFGDYGFPESHAASFANLVYVSAWLKCHYPAAFAAALLNSQPMGFYAPAQIVRDARQHGVEVRAVDVNHSDWDCSLEAAGATTPQNPETPPIGNPAWRAPEDRALALRLGFREVKGLSQDTADDIVERRDSGYAHMSEIQTRVRPRAGMLEKLARADAFASLHLDRRAALWAVKGLDHAAPLPLFEHVAAHDFRRETEVALPEMSLGEQVADDYRALKLSLKAHPMTLLRGAFDAEKTLRCADLMQAREGARVRVAGLVLIRQRPGEGNAIFITIEDETGIANIIVWPHQMERYRRAILTSSLLCVEGKLQREGIVIHIIADRMHNMTRRLDALSPRRPGERARTNRIERAESDKLIPASRDFH